MGSKHTHCLRHIIFFCVYCARRTKSAGLAAPVLAEVFYDKGGPVAPLLLFGPTMILTGFFAGESFDSGISCNSSTSTRSFTFLHTYRGQDAKRAFATQPMIPRTERQSQLGAHDIQLQARFFHSCTRVAMLSCRQPTAAACCRGTCLL